jgi:hypothetical protein
MGARFSFSSTLFFFLFSSAFLLSYWQAGWHA